MYKQHNISYYFLSILLVAIASCTNQPTPANEASAPAAQDSAQHNTLTLSAEQLKTIALDTVSLQQKQIEKTVQLTGKVAVTPDHLTSLSSVLGGHIKSIHVLQGQPFKKGQVIATLADMQFIQLQQDYLTARADWQSVKENYERQQKLNMQQATSDKAFELARADFQKLNATLRALEQKLRLLHIDPPTLSADNIRQTLSIYAPFSGTVSKVFVNTGQYVGPTDIMFELIDPRGLVLRLKTFEKDMPLLRNGQKITAFTNTSPENRKPASIISKVASLDDDGAGSVYARLDQADPSWVAGTYVNAEVSVSNYRVHSLPQVSIVSFENKQYVFQQTGAETFAWTAVELGAAADGYVEIKNAESLGAYPIVQKGAYHLLMAMKNKADD